MSDMVLVDWRDKTAKPSRLAIAHAGGLFALRVVLRHPLLVAGLHLLGLAGGLVMAWPDASPASLGADPKPAKAAQVAPAWLDIVKPIEIFSLEAGDFAKAAKVYTARRHRIGGGRQDVLTLGVLGGENPAVRLSLYRRGVEDYAKAPVFAEIARQAAEAGLSVARSGLPNLLTTRFGRFEIADVALERGPGQTRAAMPCSGFRLVLREPALTIAGLACGGRKAVMAGDKLACLLDRLDLASGGDDRPLVDFFAASEMKRNSACAGTRLGPDTAHAAWLDDRLATPHKILRHH